MWVVFVLILLSRFDGIHLWSPQVWASFFKFFFFFFWLLIKFDFYNFTIWFLIFLFFVHFMAFPSTQQKKAERTGNQVLSLDPPESWDRRANRCSQNWRDRQMQRILASGTGARGQKPKAAWAAGVVSALNQPGGWEIPSCSSIQPSCLIQRETNKHDWAVLTKTTPPGYRLTDRPRPNHRP